MKCKPVLGILTAICAGSCALALSACGILFNRNQNDPYEEPDEKEQECLNIGLSNTDHYYGTVCGLGTITSTDIEIPATYDFGGEYGELPIEAVMSNAFKNTAITSVSIPATVTFIGDNAFSGCTALTTVTMADGAEYVEFGKYVFENCTSLSSVILSDAVTYFDMGTFKNCSALTSLTLPDNLQSIGENAFEGTHITDFDVTGCENFDWSGGFLVNKNTSGGFIAAYVNPEATEVTMPKGVTVLEPKLFKNNKNIRTVDLNETEIYIGHDAFADSSLEELLNYDNAEADLSAFEGTPWLENMLMGSKNLIMGKAFLLYRGEKTVFYVPDGIKKIGARAFAGTAIQSVILPDSVDSIGNQAFADCNNLESVILDSRPPYLASGDIFPKQTVIYVPASWLSYYKSYIIWKNSVTNQILPNPSAGLAYTLSDDQTYYVVSYRSATGDVIIPDSYKELPVKAIRNRGFYGVGITSIKIPNSVTSIGDEAFSHCRNLKSVTISESVISIGFSAFENCESLESVIFESTGGWQVAASSVEIGGIDISGDDLKNTETAAKLLTQTYRAYCWRRRAV